MPARRAALVAFAAAVLSGCAGGTAAPDQPAPATPAAQPPITARAGAQPSAAAAKADGPVVGLNLSTVNDWSREWPFTDVFRAARPWTVDGAKPSEDAHGNPVPEGDRPAWTLVVRELKGHYPGGKYVATWEGKGEVEVKRWDVAKVLKQTKNRAEVEVKPGDYGIQLDVKATDPADPVRNFRVTMPGFENAKGPFHPVFLDRVGPAKVLRFMDWGRTNGSPLAKWADRPKPAENRYSTDKGVPIEEMIELANLKKADPWFCVPHLADDEYVREFAKLVKAKLDPSRTVYLEYSNEVWNWQFPQTKWAREQGVAAKLGDPEHARFYSQRSVEIFKLWEAEFGKGRLVRVLASQSAVPWLTEQILTWKDAYRNADAIAIAPYFGHEFGDPKNAAAAARMTPEALVAALDKEVDGQNREQIRKNAALARKYQLRLVAYEGGQHLVGVNGAENNVEIMNLFHAANRHPRMYDVYRKHLNHWTQAGGDVYVLFAYVAAPSKWGSWGLLEYQDQPVKDAPKYRAYLDHAAGKGDR